MGTVGKNTTIFVVVNFNLNGPLYCAVDGDRSGDKLEEKNKEEGEEKGGGVGRGKG